MHKNFFEVIDAYLYNSYIIYQSNCILLNNTNLTTPFYYYKNIFIKNDFVKTNNLDSNIYDFIKRNNNNYLFLINDDGILKNPEFFNEVDLENINEILKRNPNDFYALSAYTIYYYNKGNLDLNKYFENLLSIEKNNPYILVRYSRYQASALYKKYKDKKYLLLGKENILLALKQIKNKKEIPTFFYSWLGYIEHELGNYENAIKLYNNTILLNKKIGVDVPEPYLWKAFSLNKLLLYNESLVLSIWFLKNKKLNKYNDKRDFRFYKVLSDNYYQLGDYKNFKKYLTITIKKFLEFSSFHFNYGGLKLFLDINTSKFYFSENIILLNSYNSFFDYNKKYIKSDIDKIIFSISFLYKEMLLGKDIGFLDSRGIEKLCYNYLKYIYEGK